MTNKNKVKKFFKINEVIFKILLYSFTTTFIYIFLRINFNGGVGTISINSIGEQGIETIIVFIFLISVIIKQIGERLKWNL